MSNFDSDSNEDIELTTTTFAGRIDVSDGLNLQGFRYNYRWHPFHLLENIDPNKKSHVNFLEFTLQPYESTINFEARMDMYRRYLRGGVFSQNTFPTFCGEYKDFIKLVLLIRNRKSTPLFKVCDDVMMYKILPFTSELETYRQFHPVLGPLQRIDFLKSATQAELCEQCTYYMKRLRSHEGLFSDLKTDSSADSSIQNGDFIEIYETLQYFKIFFEKCPDSATTFSMKEKENLVIFLLHLILTSAIDTSEINQRKRARKATYVRKEVGTMSETSNIYAPRTFNGVGKIGERFLLGVCSHSNERRFDRHFTDYMKNTYQGASTSSEDCDLEIMCKVSNVASKILLFHLRQPSMRYISTKVRTVTHPQKPPSEDVKKAILLSLILLNSSLLLPENEPPKVGLVQVKNTFGKFENHEITLTEYIEWHSRISTFFPDVLKICELIRRVLPETIGLWHGWEFLELGNGKDDFLGQVVDCELKFILYFPTKLHKLLKFLSRSEEFLALPAAELGHGPPSDNPPSSPSLVEEGREKCIVDSGHNYDSLVSYFANFETLFPLETIDVTKPWLPHDIVVLMDLMETSTDEALIARLSPYIFSMINCTDSQERKRLFSIDDDGVMPHPKNIMAKTKVLKKSDPISREREYREKQFSIYFCGKCKGSRQSKCRCDGPHWRWCPDCEKYFEVAIYSCPHILEFDEEKELHEVTKPTKDDDSEGGDSKDDTVREKEPEKPTRKTKRGEFVIKKAQKSSCVLEVFSRAIDCHPTRAVVSSVVTSQEEEESEGEEEEEEGNDDVEPIIPEDIQLFDSFFNKLVKLQNLELFKYPDLFLTSVLKYLGRSKYLLLLFPFENRKNFLDQIFTHLDTSMTHFVLLTEHRPLIFVRKHLLFLPLLILADREITRYFDDLESMSPGELEKLKKIVDRKKNLIGFQDLVPSYRKPIEFLKRLNEAIGIMIEVYLSVEDGQWKEAAAKENPHFQAKFPSNISLNWELPACGFPRDMDVDRVIKHEKKKKMKSKRKRDRRIPGIPYGRRILYGHDESEMEMIRVRRAFHDRVIKDEEEEEKKKAFRKSERSRWLAFLGSIKGLVPKKQSVPLEVYISSFFSDNRARIFESLVFFNKLYRRYYKKNMEEKTQLDTHQLSTLRSAMFKDTKKFEKQVEFIVQHCQDIITEQLLYFLYFLFVKSSSIAVPDGYFVSAGVIDLIVSKLQSYFNNHFTSLFCGFEFIFSYLLRNYDSLVGKEEGFEPDGVMTRKTFHIFFDVFNQYIRRCQPQIQDTNSVLKKYNSMMEGSNWGEDGDKSMFDHLFSLQRSDSIDYDKMKPAFSKTSGIVDTFIPNKKPKKVKHTQLHFSEGENIKVFDWGWRGKGNTQEERPEEIELEGIFVEHDPQFLKLFRLFRIFTVGSGKYYGMIESLFCCWNILRSVNYTNQHEKMKIILEVVGEMTSVQSLGEVIQERSDIWDFVVDYFIGMCHQKKSIIIDSKTTTITTTVTENNVEENSIWSIVEMIGRNLVQNHLFPKICGNHTEEKEQTKIMSLYVDAFGSFVTTVLSTTPLSDVSEYTKILQHKNTINLYLNMLLDKTEETISLKNELKEQEQGDQEVKVVKSMTNFFMGQRFVKRFGKTLNLQYDDRFLVSLVSENPSVVTSIFLNLVFNLKKAVSDQESMELKLLLRLILMDLQLFERILKMISKDSFIPLDDYFQFLSLLLSEDEKTLSLLKIYRRNESTKDLKEEQEENTMKEMFDECIGLGRSISRLVITKSEEFKNFEKRKTNLSFREKDWEILEDIRMMENILQFGRRGGEEEYVDEVIQEEEEETCNWGPSFDQSHSTSSSTTTFGGDRNELSNSKNDLFPEINFDEPETTEKSTPQTKEEESSQDVFDFGETFYFGNQAPLSFEEEEKDEKREGDNFQFETLQADLSEFKFEAPTMPEDMKNI